MEHFFEGGGVLNEISHISMFRQKIFCIKNSLCVGGMIIINFQKLFYINVKITFGLQLRRYSQFT